MQMAVVQRYPIDIPDLDDASNAFLVRLAAHNHQLDRSQ